jgi:hypothetical protein
MGWRDWLPFGREKEDPELARRRRLLEIGRIAEGFVTDIETDADGNIRYIFYRYTANGSDFDSSQELLGEQLERQGLYGAGQTVSVRYDPRQPVNSFIA